MGAGQSRGARTRIVLRSFCLLLLVLLACRRDGEVPLPEPEPSAADGWGWAMVRPSDPVVVNARGTWRFVFIAGRGGIPRGGGVVFQVSPWWGWSRPQVEAPSAPGYCTVTTSATACELDIGGDPQRYYVVALVAQGALAEGDTVAFVYGDTQGGSHPQAAAKADTYAERFQEFLFKTDGDGDGVYGEIRSQPGFRIKSLPASGLWINAPRLVRPGRPFEVSVAALDPLSNRDLEYEARLEVRAEPDGISAPRHVSLRPEDGGARRFQAAVHQPGLYSITVEDHQRGLTAESCPILCGRGEAFRPVYWGDIHGHTILSDGTGHPFDHYAYARDAAGLDVAAITDHAALGLRPLRGDPWGMIQLAAERFNDPGRFVTLLGYEWTNWTYGHRNVYFPGATGVVFSPYDSGAATPEGLWNIVKKWSAITIPHHVGGGPVAIDWEQEPRPSWEMLTEIFSVHGNCEYYGCPGMIYHPKEGHFVQDALGKGRRLGILASGDGHIGHPGRWTPDYREGLVAFQAAELSREAIWECLTSRRVYGTSGARILLQFTVSGWPMGSEIEGQAFREPRRCEMHVLGAGPLRTLEILKNNDVVKRIGCDGLLESVVYTDSTAARKGDFYYARVTQQDGHQAWSSPVWLGEE